MEKTQPGSLSTPPEGGGSWINLNVKAELKQNIQQDEWLWNLVVEDSSKKKKKRVKSHKAQCIWWIWLYQRRHWSQLVSLGQILSKAPTTQQFLSRVYFLGKFLHLSTRWMEEMLISVFWGCGSWEAALGLGGCLLLGSGGRLTRRRSREQMCTWPVPLNHAMLAKNARSRVRHRMQCLYGNRT